MARRIIFDEKKISEIRDFMEVKHNTVAATANRFGVSEDTIRRIMHENNIAPGHPEKRNVVRNVTSQEEDEIINVYICTDICIKDICKQFKIENYVLQAILRKYFTEEEIKQRKSRIYRKSRLGEKNPAYGTHMKLTGDVLQSVIDDSVIPYNEAWYKEVKKPDWYTGRHSNGSVFEHTLVMCQALGLTELPKGYVVHHIDRNKHNNDISNLALMSLSAHGKLHSIEKKMMQSKVQRLSRTGVDHDGDPIA